MNITKIQDSFSSLLTMSEAQQIANECQADDDGWDYWIIPSEAPGLFVVEVRDEDGHTLGHL
jgi:hypothetical protein